MKKTLTEEQHLYLRCYKMAKDDLAAFEQSNKQESDALNELVNKWATYCERLGLDSVDRIDFLQDNEGTTFHRHKEKEGN